MTNDEAGKIIAYIAAEHRQSKWSDTRIAIWMESLIEFDAKLAERAVKAVMRSSMFEPSIAEVRHAIIELTLNLPNAYEAWDQVLAASRPRQREYCVTCAGRGFDDAAKEVVCAHCRGEGSYLPPRVKLSRPVEKTIAHFGGLEAIRSSDRQDILRTQFLKAYDAIRAAIVKQENLLSLGVRPSYVERHLQPALDAPTGQLEEGST